MKRKQFNAILGMGVVLFAHTCGNLWAAHHEDVNDVNGIEISVTTVAELEAAFTAANPGDTILLAEGTYMLTDQLAIKSGVTIKGAGADSTIIDGGNTTRAFVAWGDRGATAGQVDANGVGIPNTTGPTDWVLDGLTIQNCVSDANDRFSYAGAALDLLGLAEENDSFEARDLDLSGGLDVNEADADNGGIRLPGPDGIEPSEDDDTHRFDAMDTDGNGELSIEELETQRLSDAAEFGEERDDGGVLVTDNGAVGTIQNCTFKNNSTLADVVAADGGAIIINASTITIADCNFVGNTSTDKAGALLVGVAAEVLIQNCDFVNNYTAAGGTDTNNNGGAVIVWGQSKVTMDTCRFEGNTANNGNGGALHTSDFGTELTLEACTFEGNKADGEGRQGGAMQIVGQAMVTMNDCKFYDNTAINNAGHIKMGGNSASAVTPGTTLIAKGCDFAGGRSGNNGGVFQSWAQGSIVRFDACQFFNNGAGNHGGVIEIGNQRSGELTITNSIFFDNRSGGNRMLRVRRNTKIINCTFYGNETSSNGLIRNHSQLVDTDGDGVDDEFTDFTQVVNCLFVKNVVANQVLESRNTAYSIIGTNCLFFDNTKYGGDPAANVQNNRIEVGSIEADPLLDELLMPGPGSPAIDAGVDPMIAVGVEVTTDYSGNSRPQGNGYDIGADEQ